MIKLKDLITEGKPRAGDYVKTAYGIAQINKIRRTIAYMTLPDKGKWLNDIKHLKPTGKKEKGKTLWTEGKLTEGVKLGDVREELEYAYEWDYVEQEGGDSVRFDWGRGRKSMWVHKNGKASGEIPKDNHLKKAMKKLRIKEGMGEQKLREAIRKIIREDFAGSYPEHKRKSFDGKRRKQSEVLGYKLTGVNDVKTEIDDATVKEHMAGGLTYKKGKTVTVTHKTSGKELVIIDKPNVRKEYEKIGYVAEGKLTEKKESAIDVAKRIVKDKQYEQGVDMQTANLILKIYNAYDKHPALQKKFEKMPLKKMAQNVWRFVKWKNNH